MLDPASSVLTPEAAMQRRIAELEKQLAAVTAERDTLRHAYF